MQGFSTYDPHDAEWETGDGFRTVATQADDDYCEVCWKEHDDCTCEEDE